MSKRHRISLQSSWPSKILLPIQMKIGLVAAHKKIKEKKRIKEEKKKKSGDKIFSANFQC